MEDQNRLMEQFMQVYTMLHRFQSFAFHARGPGGSPHRGQGRVLSILKMQPKISQKELGYLLDMRNQSLGELLSKLERKGFIIRTPSQEDRRTTVIELTPAGREAAGQTEKRQSEADQLFACLSSEQQAQLEELLVALESGLEKQFAELYEQFHRELGHRSGHPYRHSHHSAPPPGFGMDGKRDRFFDRCREGSPFGPRDGRPPQGRGDPENGGGEGEE